MVQNCVRELTSIVDSMENANWMLVRSQAKLLSKYENIADDLHREAVIQIAQGAFFAGMREDFLDLIEKVDDIADAAQDAVRVIAEAPIEHKNLEYFYTGDFTLRRYVENINACVMTLSESISILRTNGKGAVNKALEVEKLEEEVDRIENELTSKLFAHRQNVDIFTYLQIREMLFKLDEVADAAENCSDLIITIVVKAVS